MTAGLPSIRRARTEDVPALNALIALSASHLSEGYYSEAERQALIEDVFGVDTQLIQDGTYFVVERNGEAVACGGWSARRTLFGGDQHKEGVDDRLDPEREPARIRAFFVHPAAARQGLARRLLDHCEAEALRAGFSRTELMATLPGVPFYQARGYLPVEDVTHLLPRGMGVRFVRMGRAISGCTGSG